MVIKSHPIIEMARFKSRKRGGNRSRKSYGGAFLEKIAELVGERQAVSTNATSASSLAAAAQAAAKDATGKVKSALDEYRAAAEEKRQAEVALTEGIETGKKQIAESEAALVLEQEGIDNALKATQATQLAELAAAKAAQEAAAALETARIQKEADDKKAAALKVAEDKKAAAEVEAKQKADAVDEKYKMLQTKKADAEEKQRAASDAFKVAAQAANAQSKKVSNAAGVAASDPRSFTKALEEFNANTTNRLTKYNASTNLSNETLQKRRNGIAASKAARNARSGVASPSTIASSVMGNAFNASAAPALNSKSAAASSTGMASAAPAPSYANVASGISGAKPIALSQYKPSQTGKSSGGRRRKYRTHKKRHARKTHRKLRK
jgi:hypothetical protein